MISELCDFLDKRTFNRMVLKDEALKSPKQKVVNVTTSGKVMML
jgi:hypothetical protein